MGLAGQSRDEPSQVIYCNPKVLLSKLLVTFPVKMIIVCGRGASLEACEAEALQPRLSGPRSWVVTALT